MARRQRLHAKERDFRRSQPFWQLQLGPAASGQSRERVKILSFYEEFLKSWEDTDHGTALECILSNQTKGT